MIRGLCFVLCVLAVSAELVANTPSLLMGSTKCSKGVCPHVAATCCPSGSYCCPLGYDCVEPSQKQSSCGCTDCPCCKKGVPKFTPPEIKKESCPEGPCEKMIREEKERAAVQEAGKQWVQAHPFKPQIVASVRKPVDVIAVDPANASSEQLQQVQLIKQRQDYYRSVANSNNNNNNNNVAPVAPVAAAKPAVTNAAPAANPSTAVKPSSPSTAPQSKPTEASKTPRFQSTAEVMNDLPPYHAADASFLAMDTQMSQLPPFTDTNGVSNSAATTSNLPPFTKKDGTVAAAAVNVAKTGDIQNEEAKVPVIEFRPRIIIENHKMTGHTPAVHVAVTPASGSKHHIHMTKEGVQSKDFEDGKGRMKVHYRTKFKKSNNEVDADSSLFQADIDASALLEEADEIQYNDNDDFDVTSMADDHDVDDAINTFLLEVESSV